MINWIDKYFLEKFPIPNGSIHTSQEIEITTPIKIGSKLTCRAFLDSIKEIRGRGLMIGFVIDHEKFNLIKKTDQNPSIYMVNELAKNGLLTVPAGPDVIRWLPPLNVKKSEVKEAIQIMISTLDKEAK